MIKETLKQEEDIKTPKNEEKDGEWQKPTNGSPQLSESEKRIRKRKYDAGRKLNKKIQASEEKERQNYNIFLNKFKKVI